MERFSAEVRAANPKDKGFDAAEEELARLIALRVDFFDGFDWSPISKIPFKFYAFLQIGLRRTIELSEACIREINGGHLSAMCVLSRGALETAALIYDTMQRVRTCVQEPEKTTLEEVDQHLMSVFMGHKAEAWKVQEEFQAKNILTILDRLKKSMPDSHLDWFYDGLSEHSHPNYHGMYASYTQLSDGPTTIAVFTDARESRIPLTTSLALSGISLAMVMMEEGLKREAELRIPFAEMCEKRLYDQGKWPEGEDYPVKR